VVQKVRPLFIAFQLITPKTPKSICTISVKYKSLKFVSSFIYLFIYLFINLLIYLLIYLLTYIHTYLLTYLLSGQCRKSQKNRDFVSKKLKLPSFRATYIGSIWTMNVAIATVTADFLAAAVWFKWRVAVCCHSNSASNFQSANVFVFTGRH